jgi:hypothetical protein
MRPYEPKRVSIETCGGVLETSRPTSPVYMSAFGFLFRFLDPTAPGLLVRLVIELSVKFLALELGTISVASGCVQV